MIRPKYRHVYPSGYRGGGLAGGWWMSAPVMSRRGPLDQNGGYVYFVRFRTCIKIGFSSDVDRRLGELARMGYGEPMLLAKVEGTLKDEARIHRKFEHHLLTGREWFRPDAEIVRFVDSLIDAGLAR